MDLVHRNIVRGDRPIVGIDGSRKGCGGRVGYTPASDLTILFKDHSHITASKGVYNASRLLMN